MEGENPDLFWRRLCVSYSWRDHGETTFWVLELAERSSVKEELRFKCVS